MRRLFSLSLMALLAVGASACSKKDAPTEPVATIETTTFAPSLNVNLAAMTKAPEGYYYQNLQEGTGDIARAGDSLEVVYTSYLADGTAFAVANSFNFRLGVTATMQGFTLGLIGAPLGGRRRLIIPPNLGFGNSAIIDGSNGRVVVPKNSVLIYDISIVRAVR